MSYYKFVDQQLRTAYNSHFQEYHFGEWVLPEDGLQPEVSTGACGPGSLHLMKMVRPTYAPSAYRVFEAEGQDLLGEDREMARFKAVRLVRELTPAEINEGIDDDWAHRLGKRELFSDIAWARTATFLDRPVDTVALEPALRAVAQLVNQPTKILWVTPALGGSLRESLVAPLVESLGDSLVESLGESLRESLGASLGDSLWESLGDSLLVDSLVAPLVDSLVTALGAALVASLGASLRESLGAALRESLGDSLRDPLGASLRESLWDSLLFERGYALVGQSRPELQGLLTVWQAGALPVGFTRKAFVILIPDGRNA